MTERGYLAISSPELICPTTLPPSGHATQLPLYVVTMVRAAGKLCWLRCFSLKEAGTSQCPATIVMMIMKVCWKVIDTKFTISFNLSSCFQPSYRLNGILYWSLIFASFHIVINGINVSSIVKCRNVISAHISYKSWCFRIVVTIMSQRASVISLKLCKWQTNFIYVLQLLAGY